MGVPSAGSLRSFAVRASGSYVVFVHGTLPPPQSEWNVVLDIFRNHPNLAAVRTLVFTEGAAPSAVQRADLNHVLGKIRMPTAVMTSSTISRAAGTALSWLNPGFKVFAATDFDGAFDHLGASANDRRMLRDLVDELRRELTSRSGGALRREG
jgi:hypothetical protein